MADCSGERVGDPNTVCGSDRIDQDPCTGGGAGQHSPTDRASSVGTGTFVVAARQPPPASESGREFVGPAVFGLTAALKARKDRSRRFIFLGAAGATLAAVAVVVVIAVADRKGGQAGRLAGAVVKDYLEALARGDAETALSYGIDRPTTTEFLTSNVLKRQVAQWPIRNIRILHDNSAVPEAALSMAHVHVVAAFGDHASDAVVDLRMDHNRWALASAAIKFTPGLGASMGNAAAKTVTVFGKPVSDAAAYVFPGWIDIGTTNPYMTVTVPPLLLDQITMAAPFWVHPTFALSDRGRDAVRAQLAAAMANCQKSNLLAPPGCPMHLASNGMAEGSVVWGAADLSAVTLDKFDAYRLTQAFSGQVAAPITVRASGGATRQEGATEFLSGVADLAKTPPEVIFY